MFNIHIFISWVLIIWMHLEEEKVGKPPRLTQHRPNDPFGCSVKGYVILSEHWDNKFSFSVFLHCNCCYFVLHCAPQFPHFDRWPQSLVRSDCLTDWCRCMISEVLLNGCGWLQGCYENKTFLKSQVQLLFSWVSFAVNHLVLKFWCWQF